MERFGKVAFPFRSTSMLRIHGPDCSITGIRRLKEIRLMLGKDADHEAVAGAFEQALSEWLAAERSEEDNG